MKATHSGIYTVLFFLIGSLMWQTGSAQFERLQPEVRGTENAQVDAWKGGLANPQFSSMDIDRDGQRDLVVFDRNGNALMPFIKTDGGQEYGYEYRPDLADLFPDLDDWMLLRDYNRDGIADIFCKSVVPGIPGITVYRGVIRSGVLDFELLRFDGPFPEVIQIPAGSSNTNLYTSFIDIPAIEDFDGDGDLDIASFESGGTYISYYRNFSQERGNGNEELDFELEDFCWGKIFESEFSEEISLSDDPNDCAEGLAGEVEIENRHAGSTLMAFDSDGDELMDMLVGDLASGRIILLENNGTQSEAYVTSQELRYPSESVSIDLPSFVATFYEDVNQDGVRDLIASPNSDAAVETINIAWYYENLGEDDNPDFNFVQRDLFVENILDFGVDAAPALVDYNADGLLDLVVGTSGTRNSDGNLNLRLILFENVGTPDEPVYDLVDEDYLGFSEFFPQFFALAPTFGDLDGDGDEDLVVGNSSGTLFYGENTAGAGEPIDIDFVFPDYEDIRVSNFSTPTIADVNQDGLPDLIVGERNANSDSNGNPCGVLNYFQNMGVVGSPSFNPDEDEEPNTSCLGGVLVERSDIFSYGSSPDYISLNGEDFLFVTSDNGSIDVYTDLSSNIYGNFTLFEEDFGDVDEGFRSHVATGDINADGLIDMIVGNNRGGLSIFQSNLTVDGVLVGTDTEIDDEEVSIYPNPASDLIQINAPNGSKIRIYDLQGREVVQQIIDRGALRLNLRAGCYIVQIESSDNRVAVEKLVVY